MLRHPNLLTAGVLLLCMGSISASALPLHERTGAASATAVDRVQYSDGGRCFNRCVTGRIFHRCQTPTEGNRSTCCSQVCTRFNNQYYR